MDWSYSPHREAGGTLHLPSPTHSPHYDAAAIQKLRRSMSRSPSKPMRTRHNISRSPSVSPAAQLSPLRVVRAASPILAKENNGNVISFLTPTESRSTQKPKFTLRRVAPFRSSPRISVTSKSPMRRALSDTSNQGNVGSATERRSSGEDNSSVSSASSPKERDNEKTSAPEMEFTHLHPGHAAAMAEHLTPARASPLKRVDRRISFDQPEFGTPAKRRSTFGSSQAPDFDIFSQNVMPCFDDDLQRSQAQEQLDSPFASPAPRRSTSLRKSAHQRQNLAANRHRTTNDHANDCLPAQRNKQRQSLDPTFLVGPQQESPFVKLALPRVSLGRPSLQQPHPLSNALTASSSGSSLTESSLPETFNAETAAPKAPRYQHSFAKSLPLGVPRPTECFLGEESSTSSFETPNYFKFSRPNPNAFLSTGVISKKNRNAEVSHEPVYQMPDTPSKRASFPPVTGSPLPEGAFRKIGRPKFEFSGPDSPLPAGSYTPLGLPKSSLNFPASSKGVLSRAQSFVSSDGDDLGYSPLRPQDGQSSADELPPTPTKPAGKKEKESSLRSSLFGRRVSINPDTFIPPSAVEIPNRNSNGLSPNSKLCDENVPPHTPIDTFTPPDPSGLSISAGQPKWVNCLATSTMSNGSFPPATPTAQRDYVFPFQGNGVINQHVRGVTNNDVDTSLASRFNHVSPFGTGEFSQVFRVEGPIDNPLAPPPSPGKSGVWIVKKSKKPFTGSRDKDRRYREVAALRALKGNNHIVSIVDAWEAKGHLYIQTEFCEDGNLRDFALMHGIKGRLDDFRIWKIMLELSIGIKHIHDNGFIHLDLKPANVFIDFEGVLKIGDFGLASTWPAPSSIDGEGDREYMAPEILNGRFDKPADIYAFGIIMLEIAANMELPSYGEGWQRLRHGDLANIPSLTFSSASTLPRNDDGDPISPSRLFGGNHSSLSSEESGFSTIGLASRRPNDLATPPAFMIDAEHACALDHVVWMMLQEDPNRRPTIDEITDLEGVQWVQRRRRGGAAIYEGPWGPGDELLDVDMTDV